MFNEDLLKLPLPGMEEDILKFWQNDNTFQKSMDKNKKNKPFVFYEGPPTANGKPGIHHILSRVMKDIFCRYKTMKGKYVLRKGGWDTHGLPVELEIEKELGLKSKKDIEEYGIKEFNKKCKESVMKYEKDWRELTERIAFWVDVDNPYITFKNDYIQSVWWILKKFWEKGFLYKGHKIVPYCSRCGTPLSSHEVAQGYRDVDDPSIFIKFKLLDDDRKILVWTTTPWTLTANVSLAVGADFDYCLVDYEGEKIILAESRLECLDEKYNVLKKYKGRELAGLKYEPLLDFGLLPEEEKQKGYRVITADFVSLDDGTGVVHLAPAFGEDDYRAGQENDLPFLQPVELSGEYSKNVPHWGGMFVKDADPKIIKHLKDEGKLLKAEKYTHAYPFCWRCDTPLLYYARSSWYIKTTAFKDDLLKANNAINWYPEHIKKGRFGDWLENNIDWAISRERYWGTPLNLWICADCDEYHAVESVEELSELTGKDLSNLDLHRPFIDEIKFPCKKCNKEMQRVPEVVDCWFDSGAMPVAQWHYPRKNEKRFLENFPCDYISEAIDQTRGWFYSLLAISTFLHKKSPYKNCLVLGFIQDKQGKKMSKSKGNAVDPWDVIKKHGVDTIRWYMYSSSKPWDNKRFYEDALATVEWSFFNTLKNTVSFFTMYANIDGIELKKIIDKKFKPDAILDKWIISRLNSLVGRVDELMEKYDLTRAARMIEKFVEDLSNWYVRTNRRRFWKDKMGSDKLDAYKTLYVCLNTLSKLMAPFTPFWSEFVFQTLNGKEKSVHLEDFPKKDDKLINVELEEKINLTRDIVYLGRSVRNTAKLKIRQPVSRILLHSVDKAKVSLAKDTILEYSKIIFDELNVKNVEYVDDIGDYLTYEAKLNFKEAGPKFGKRVNKIKEIVENLDHDKAVKFVNTSEFHCSVDGKDFTVADTDVTFNTKAMEDYASIKEGDLVVLIETKLDDELIKEGLVRELVNKVQNLRKELGFNIVDRIEFFYDADANVEKAVEKYKDYLSTEILAIKISKTSKSSDWKDLKLNDRPISLKIQKVTKS